MENFMVDNTVSSAVLSYLVTRPLSAAATDGPNTISGILNGVIEQKLRIIPNNITWMAPSFVLTCHNLKTWRHYYAHALISIYVSLFPVHVVLWLIDLLTVGRWQAVSLQVFDALTNDFMKPAINEASEQLLLALATWFGGLLKFCWRWRILLCWSTQSCCAQVDELLSYGVNVTVYQVQVGAKKLTDFHLDYLFCYKNENNAKVPSLQTIYKVYISNAHCS